uniref:No apical meristem-associated C-terminal domain-containing protein n=1 Tax=Tanacetum cinerariifolium TaxID=118510 RepID=A0A6L2J4U9_TANCI|nr:hypothetical protein [Tanacetum cinerariifolium]
MKSRHESEACENTIYQKAKKEYSAYYKSAFPIVECWNILNNHKKWKNVEYPKYLRDKYLGAKKSRTPESTSDSAHIGLNLNDEATGSGDKEASSTAADTGLVYVFLSKFTQCGTPLFSSRNEAFAEYLRIKERELEMQDQRRRKEAELERLNLAQAEKFELQQEEKWEKDVMYYNESHDHLTERALSTALLLKK